jgi:sugar lactone lactonase YvrE
VNVKFSPLAPGPRSGAVELLSGTGALLASGQLQGIGVGPQATFGNTTSGPSIPVSMFDVGSGFNGPGGVAVDASGNIFVADSYNGQIQEILAAGGWTTTKNIATGLSFPSSVALDGGGNLYVADPYNDAVDQIVAAGGYTTINSLGSGFSNPYGVAVDGRGDVFVADFANDAVKEIVAVNGSFPASPTIRTLASGVNGPDGVAVDGNGNVFVAIYGDGTVEEILAVNGSIPPSPTFKVIAGGLGGPSNLSVDGIGNLFVTDTENDQVEEFLAAGGFTKVKILGSGFSFPEGVAVRGNGDVMIADTGNNAVALLPYASPPALAFATTPVGTASGDSPQTVTVSNDGNAPLIFSLPSSGKNPSVATNFTWDPTSTCVQTNSGSSQAFQLAGGASCTMAFDFNPTTTGPLNGGAVLTNNNLNLAGASQTIALSGTGSAPVPAVLTSPAPGSTLPGTTATFGWKAGQGASKYELKLGSTGPGSTNVYNGPVTTALTTPSITNLPANGVTLYARLFSFINGGWLYNDYTYIESGSPTKAILTSPTPGNTLAGSSVTFGWTAGGGVTQYELKLGTTGVGSTNVYNGLVTTSLTSGSINNIPTTGATLYARLFSYINGAWQYNDYTYKEQ